MAKGKYKYHYFYKITNLLNEHYYYGIHSTNNLEDGYMGSGSRLHHAYKKYGMENFQKEILKYFDTREELALYEADVVTEELVLDHNCYNISCGGEKWNTLHSISVIDKDGNTFRCAENDPRYLNGEYVGVTTGTFTALLSDGTYRNIKCADKDKYENAHGTTYGKIRVKDNDGHKKMVDKNDPNIGLLYTIGNKNMLTAKDSAGNYYYISKYDERYISGELVYMWKGKHHSEETKKKLSISCVEKKLGKNNPMYGKCWITNILTNESIRVDKNNILTYLENGWKKGRRMKK